MLFPQFERPRISFDMGLPGTSPSAESTMQKAKGNLMRNQIVLDSIGEMTKASQSYHNKV